MKSSSFIHDENAPDPMGAYPHARRVGNFLFVSGIGSRIPKINEIPKGIEAQTEQVIANLKSILESSGSRLENVVDVIAFLVNMEQDFKGYNKVYGKHFSGIQAARTTVGIRALPSPISVEFKVIAVVDD